MLFGFGPVVSICDLHCLVQRVIGRIACGGIYEGTLCTLKCSAGFQYFFLIFMYLTASCLHCGM